MTFFLCQDERFSLGLPWGRKVVLKSEVGTWVFFQGEGITMMKGLILPPCTGLYGRTTVESVN
jgi:hypothetical protein